jgi:hypothetical protein
MANIHDLHDKRFGVRGLTYIEGINFNAGGGTNSVSGASRDYYAVYFIVNTTPTVFTVTNPDGTEVSISGPAYQAGSWVYGDIKELTVDADGAAILYKK